MIELKGMSGYCAKKANPTYIASDPRYSGELKYKAYHLSLMTIETIINRKLPFLLPFFVGSRTEALMTLRQAVQTT